MLTLKCSFNKLIFVFFLVYKLSNESICDLLYDLCTNKDAYIIDKVQVLLEWVEKLKLNYSNNTARCNNPQSGFVKCIASILWYIYAENNVAHLSEQITQSVFDACMHWIDRLEYEEPLKVAFDSLLCSLCYIQPKFFNHLLSRLNVTLAHTEATDIEAMTDNLSKVSNDKCGLTDDNKEISGKVWYANVAAENLTTLFARPSYLATIAMACQSPNAVFQLVDSGLPKLLAYALYEYCSTLLLQEDVSQSTAAASSSTSTSTDRSTAPCTFGTQFTTYSSSTSSTGCMTDADKVAEDKMEVLQSETEENSNQPQLMTFDLVPKILDFFSECCSEGHMRDWLGTQQGSIFWKPLLKLLCNHRPINFVPIKPIISREPTQQAFIRMERATINFFARVTACHPNNQNILTMLLIEVIREPSVVLGLASDNSCKQSISGFTRQLVLQLLLENERILVSVRSKQPLQKKDAYTPYLPTTTANITSTTSANSFVTPSSVTMSLVNNHPAKRINNHHLLFSVSANTKCQEIIQNCLSGNDLFLVFLFNL